MMKRKLNTVLALLFIGIGAIAQPLCNYPLNYQSLAGNDMVAKQINGGSILGDFNGDPALEVPKGSETHSLFAASLWISGKTTSGEIKISAEGYFQQSETDFFPGPLNINEPTSYCEDFDEIWKAKAWEIHALLTDFDDNNTIDNTPHQPILAWPARGNAYFSGIHGYDLPDMDLAPFYDRDGDGLYDPYMGDFPVLPKQMSLDYQDIKNNLPSEMTWSVVNDAADAQTATNGEGFGFEIHKLTWVFGDCPDVPQIDQTLYYSLKFINKSVEQYDSVYFSLWNDFDVGGFDDDHIGCDPSTNSFFAYNADNLDLPNLGVMGYGVDPPAVACTFMNQNLSGFSGYSRDFNDPNTANSDEFFHFYLSSGRWADGTSMTFGGNGHGGMAETPFWFFGNPNIPGEWSMIDESFIGKDFRGVGSLGPLTILPGETTTLDFAYSFHRKPGEDHLGNVAAMYQEIPLVQAFYDSQFISTCNTVATKQVVREDILEIFPNPVQRKIYLSGLGQVSASAKIALYDVLGKPAFSANVSGNEVNLPHLPSGVYFLEIEWEEQKETHRIVVEQ